MKLLALIFILGFFVLVIRLTAKLLLRIISKYEDKQKRKNNPYIKYHKTKIQNDENYQDYLKWLDKDGSGVPIDKVITPEDRRAERKYKSLL